MDSSCQPDRRSALYTGAGFAVRRFFSKYFWFILKNVLGWTLILLSLVAGPLVPGPGGLPLFLIGFALVTLPGKRRFTARLLRGRPIRYATKWFARIVPLVALAAPLAVLPATRPWTRWPPEFVGPAWSIAAWYVLTAATAWLLILLALRITNALLQLVPRARRHLRPWLHHHGIRLLPPRRRHRLPHEPGSGPHYVGDEIIELGRAPRTTGG